MPASLLHLKTFLSFPNLLAEAYLEPSRKYTMKLFCENSERLLAVNYSHKKNSILNVLAGF